MVGDEALGLVILVIIIIIIDIIDGLGLDPGIGGSLAAAEEDSPDEDGHVSNDNTDNAGGSTDEKADHDGDEDTDDGSSEESSEAGVVVVMIVVELVVETVVRTAALFNLSGRDLMGRTPATAALVLWQPVLESLSPCFPSTHHGIALAGAARLGRG